MYSAAAAASLNTTTIIATTTTNVRHLQRDGKNDKRENERRKGDFDLPSSSNQMTNVEWIGDGM